MTEEVVQQLLDALELPRTTIMVTELVRLGKIPTGKLALCVLLEVIRKDMGVDNRAKVDKLLQQLREELTETPVVQESVSSKQDAQNLQCAVILTAIPIEYRAVRAHLTNLKEEIGERAVVLIVSDAGAARGNFDQERIESTKVWIKQVQQSVRYCAWLNPMPNQWWQNTTAGEIARLLPMFEMNRQGINAAIGVLRGRYIVKKQDESSCYWS